jgi:hypothetical protein
LTTPHATGVLGARGPGHGGALRHGRRGGHHHLHPGQGTRWRRRRLRGRPASVCDFLTQRARPQLFSNALPPTVAASSLAAIEYLEAHPERVTTLRENARYFRERLIELGFKPLAGETPIIPVILGETADAIRMSDLLLGEGVFVTGSAIRSCPRARPESAARSPPPIPGRTWTRPWPPSSGWAGPSSSSSCRWPPSCTPAPIVGRGRLGAATRKSLYHRGIAARSFPLPSRVFQQVSRILTYRSSGTR